jgi:hypothetical protein
MLKYLDILDPAFDAKLTEAEDLYEEMRDACLDEFCS